MPDEVRWTTPGGGPSLWLDLPKRLNLKDLQERRARRGVSIVLVQNWFLGKPHLHGFRIGYALPKPKDLSMAVEILSEEVRRKL